MSRLGTGARAHPEIGVQGQYVHHKSVKASLGIKIVAPELEKAIAGSRLLVCGEDDDEDELREEVMSDLTNLLGSVDKSGRGVCVQASTLGSLEALLEFLRVSKIPVSLVCPSRLDPRDRADHFFFCRSRGSTSVPFTGRTSCVVRPCSKRPRSSPSSSASTSPSTKTPRRWPRKWVSRSSRVRETLLRGLCKLVDR